MGATAKPAAKRTATVKDHVSWFEIPAYDLTRAKVFYDHLYGTDMETSVAGGYAMAFLPAVTGVGGAVVQGPGCVPSDCGALVYLNAGNDMDGMLSRVEEAGGRIIMGRSLISESAGWFALFLDSEGNRLALHEAPKAPAKADAPAKAASPAPKKKAGKRAATKAAAGKKKKAAKKGR